MIEFKLPKRRPKIVEKDAPPDQRSLAVVPLRAIRDRALTDGQLRALAILCSYCNRAGITWVSQGRLANDMQVSQQSISKHLKALSAAGYIEVTAKGFRGERANTTRVIYDPEIKANDAIAITSGQEDTRPPHQIKAETAQATEPEFTEEQMAANRKRLKELLGGLAGRDGFHYNKPERIGDIVARKPKAKPTPKTPHIDNTQVVNVEPLIDNIIDNTGVVQTQKNIGYEEVLSIYEDISKHRFVRTTRIDEVDLRCAAIMCEVGVSRERFIDACQTMPVHLRLSEVCEQLAGEATGC